jgi:hypothetical protein
MGRLIVVCLAAVVTLAVSPASAQDVESLRREVEALRKQLQSVTERLQAMEARPAPPRRTPRFPPRRSGLLDRDAARHARPSGSRARDVVGANRPGPPSTAADPPAPGSPTTRARTSPSRWPSAAGPGSSSSTSG